MQRAQVRFLVREPDPTCCVVCQGVGSKPTNQPNKQTKSLVKPAVLPAWIPPLCHAVARLQPCPLPGRPPNRRGPVTPGVSVLDPVGPARVAQARGTPPIPQPTSAPLPATPGCPVPPLPRGSPARPPPVSRPCSQQLSLQARVPAAQEGWGHVGKHPGRQEPPCSFVFLPPPFSLCFQILIKCAHHRCRHFTSF